MGVEDRRSLSGIYQGISSHLGRLRDTRIYLAGMFYCFRRAVAHETLTSRNRKWHSSHRSCTDGEFLFRVLQTRRVSSPSSLALCGYRATDHHDQLLEYIYSLADFLHTGR